MTSCWHFLKLCSARLLPAFCPSVKCLCGSKGLLSRRRSSSPSVVTQLGSLRAISSVDRSKSRGVSFRLSFAGLLATLIICQTTSGQDQNRPAPSTQTILDRYLGRLSSPGEKSSPPLLGPAVQTLPPGKTTGWQPNRKSADAFARLMVPLYGNQIDDLVKYSDDRDALNYKFLAICIGHRAREGIPSADQDGVGACVGYGTARAGDIVAAADVLHRRERERFVPWNPDAVYALGRQRANQLGNWDGSSGSWSIAGIQQYGTLHYLAYDSHDLSRTTPQDGKRWAATGLPDTLLRLAGEHKVSAAFRAERAEQVKAALQNGYAGILCANIGYSSTRDQDGFARQQGRWAHCMAVIAYRGPASGREGYLVSNSWGNDWISGPVWPEDQPKGSFWVTPADLQRHLDEGDSWVIAGYQGFEKRDMPWSELISRIGGGRDNDINPNVSIVRPTRIDSGIAFALAP